MLLARIITGAVLGVALTAALLFLPTVAMACVLGALWLVGAWEWGGLARFESWKRAVYFAAFVGLMGATLLFPSERAAAFSLVAALLWWAIALIAVLSYPHKFSSGTVAIAGLLVLVPSWGLLAYLHRSSSLGPALSMTVFAIVWSADVGAYVFGRWLGRVKLAPAVSPGKTWEGVSGGVLLAALTGGGAALWLGLPVGFLMSLGVATALISVLGDLAQSMFKRNVGLKDSGKLLPGHGGVLDRIDSLTAAIPVFVLGIVLAGLVD